MRTLIHACVNQSITLFVPSTLDFVDSSSKSILKGYNKYSRLKFGWFDFVASFNELEMLIYVKLKMCRQNLNLCKFMLISQ